jgi:hypothetical protein
MEEGKARSHSRLAEELQDMNKRCPTPPRFSLKSKRPSDSPARKTVQERVKDYADKAALPANNEDNAPATYNSAEIKEEAATTKETRPASNPPQIASQQKPKNTKATNTPKTDSELEKALRPFIRPGSVAFVRPSRGEMSMEECSVLINGINTTFDDMLDNARQMANSQAIPVIAIYNSTQGLLKDLLNANKSLREELAAADRECVDTTATILQLLITTKSSHQGRRRVAAHSEGTILLRYALMELHKRHYSDLSEAGFSKLIDQHFAIQHYGAPVKGVTPQSEARTIPGDPVTKLRALDRTNSTGAVSIPNTIDSDSPLPRPGLKRHDLTEHTARMAQFEAESIIQGAKGDGRAAARRFADNVRSGNVRHEAAAPVLEQILVKLKGAPKMLSDFQRELTAISKDGWIGGFEIPRELRTL